MLILSFLAALLSQPDKKEQLNEMRIVGMSSCLLGFLYVSVTELMFKMQANIFDYIFSTCIAAYYGKKH